MDDLLSLAERCEAATGPDREIDRDIALARGYYGSNPEDMGCFKDDPAEAIVTPGTTWAPPAFTASIDASAALLPEGHVWALDGGYTRAMNSAEVGLEPVGGELMQPLASGEGESPALALCAAALRARSVTEKEG